MSDPCAAALRLPAGRHLIAVAGAPASGKSTYAVRLAEDLNAKGRKAQVVPMDGFHLDNRILAARGDIARKGAPYTFDHRGFHRLMQDMKSGGSVVYPVFDRALDMSIAGAEILEPDTDLVIVEGNYLLYDHPDWRGLAKLWSLSIWFDVPEAVLTARLMQRWRDHGFDDKTATAKVRQNDLPNAVEIAARALPADMTLTQ
ncbi:nucleoside/nucleotide kinase family protein [Oceaniglobus ichthyenteri]|uniref:nucleoside/nucleotide kinase family protein n=1 Tax=Oceaniglobus ichthyenteri TaxID=2136177 RepID=UPI000D3ACE83|nr:nucleoside/nucleotide kinase family protein [Oceaniglobus ichthyenteri]